MRVSAVPNPEDDDLDPVDPLGTIYMQNEDGAELHEQNVFLDDWLEGLLSGLRRTRAGERETTIELYSDGGQLMWKAEEAGAIIHYKSHHSKVSQFRISNLDDFEKALRQAVITFTDRYRLHKNWSRCTTLMAVREWALNNPAG